MEITGDLKLKFDTNRVSDKFQKREFVLTTEINTQFPQHVIFQLTQDKVSLVDQFNPGDEIKVQFGLRGREWNGPQGQKFFNTLDVWRIELVKKGSGEFKTDAQPTNTATTNTLAQNNSGPVNTNPADDSSDLPF